MSDDDDEYDVRAVEARLARMEAKRRMRSTTMNTTQPPPLLNPPMERTREKRSVQQSCAQLGDFELSEMNSSASDSAGTSSASEDEGCGPYTTQKPKRVVKSKLKDSLDLSMSASIALPPGELLGKRAAPTRKTTRRSPNDHQAMSCDQRTPSEQAYGLHTTVEDHSDDVFAGKLIQRRRELERQAVQEPPPTTLEKKRSAVHKDSTITQMGSSIRINERPVVHQPMLEKPNGSAPTSVKPTPVVMGSRIPKPAEVHREDQQHDAIAPSRSAPQQQPRVQAPKPVDYSAQSAKQVPRAQVVAPPKPEERANNPRRESDLILPETRAPAPLAATKTVTAPTAPKAPHAIPATKEPVTKAPTATNPPSIPTTRKTVSFTVAHTPPPQPPPAAMVAPAPTATTATKTGYARTTPGSNQSHAQAAALPTEAMAVGPAKKEQQEGPEDLIDDLLTAEELRLRESLDKLSSRLSSLTTARETLTRTTKSSSSTSQSASTAQRKHQDTQREEDGEGEDDLKSVRSASYGGGTHSRLHQPTSPTARASHAKRSELSSGVHKARVRTGGVLVQDTSSVVAADGASSKHKVVIKRDLAHLLF